MLKVYKFTDSKLKEIWDEMYQGNEYLYPYSSWQFNGIILRNLSIKPRAFSMKKLFYVYSNDNGPRIIMPLVIKGNKISLLGESVVTNVGALDFIYMKNVKNEDFYMALKELMQLYSGYTVELHRVNERSRLCRFFLEAADSFKDDFDVDASIDRECVKILLPSTYEEYFRALGRNSKSNLKKIYNRMNKNEMPFELKVFKGPLNDKKVLSDLNDIYCKRAAEREHRQVNFFYKIKKRYFKAITWATQEMKEHYTFCLYIKNTPAAFMSGFRTNFNEIIFPHVATDSDFAAYSSGKLMISESVKWCQQHPDEKIAALDLSRGLERYKLEMGGIVHNSYGLYLKRK